MVVAHEKGVADRLTLVRAPVAMTEPNLDLMRVNPISKIPTLELDDGLAIQDSLVICAYLDALDGTPTMVPVAGRARWEALSRHALLNGLLDILILLRNERERPDGARSERHIAAFELKKKSALDTIATWSPEPCGDRIDLVQISLGCLLGYLDFRYAATQWRETYPQLAEWQQGFANRPAARATEPS